MRTTTAILALAGSALAAPGWKKPEYKEIKNVHVVYETVVHTVYFTEGYPAPHKPTPASSTPSQPPVVTTTVVYEEYSQAPAPTPEAPAPAPEAPAPAPEAPAPAPEAPAPAPEAPAPTPEAPAPAPEAPAPAPAPEAPAPAPAPEAPASPPAYEAAAPSPTPEAPAPAPEAPASGYQSVVDKWRAQMGLKPLANDAKLESNAMDTVVSSNGQMIHKLNDGSMGQVLAPGEAGATGFERVFLGGWLCEIPTLPGLDGVCSTASQGWDYNGQIGHAEILTADSYSKIGCALHAGIWCCDLA